MQQELISSRQGEVLVQARRPVECEHDRALLFVFFVVVDCTQKRVKDVLLSFFLRPVRRETFTLLPACPRRCR